MLTFSTYNLLIFVFLAALAGSPTCQGSRLSVYAVYNDNAPLPVRLQHVLFA